jgi:hypothetical protein
MMMLHLHGDVAACITAPILNIFMALCIFWGGHLVYGCDLIVTKIGWNGQNPNSY